jgi:hypothetical protein
MPLQFARGRETATPTKANTGIIANDPGRTHVLAAAVSSWLPSPPGYRGGGISRERRHRRGGSVPRERRVVLFLVVILFLGSGVGF